MVERQLDCQPSIRTKRKIRKVLKPQTSDGRRVAEGRNAPSVGRITRFAGLSVARRLASRFTTHSSHYRNQNRKRQRWASGILAIPMQSGYIKVCAFFPGPLPGKASPSAGQENLVKVVMLCGGLGTRLREETEYRPKPMVEIGGRPILWHIMKLYAHNGFN